jgi:hypothetical protein
VKGEFSKDFFENLKIVVEVKHHRQIFALQ